MIQNAVKTMSGSGEPMKTGDMLRMAAGMIVGIGADMAISALLGSHIPAGSGWKRVMRKLGIFIISMKIGEDCEVYFNKVFDETRDALGEARKEMQTSIPAEGSVQ